MAQLKLFDPFPRAAGTSLADFSAHWTGVHAEIAKTIPQIRHYVQLHRLAEKPAALGAPLAATWCDGSSETWYDSATELAAMLAEPSLADLVADERNFMDLSVKRYPVITHEQLLDAARFEPPRQDVKALLFLRRRPGGERERFEAELLDGAVELGRSLGITRHVLCTTAADSEHVLAHHDPEVRDGADPPYDAVRELWWESAAALEAAAEREPEAWRRLLNPAGADLPGSFALFGRERVIVP